METPTNMDPKTLKVKENIGKKTCLMTKNASVEPCSAAGGSQHGGPVDSACAFEVWGVWGSTACDPCH